MVRANTVTIAGTSMKGKQRRQRQRKERKEEIVLAVHRVEEAGQELLRRPLPSLPILDYCLKGRRTGERFRVSERAHQAIPRGALDSAVEA